MVLICGCVLSYVVSSFCFFFSSRRRHTRCALVTGVQTCALPISGKLVDTATVYPFQPRNDVRGAQAEIARLIAQHKVELIAIGNGTASRETDKLVADRSEERRVGKECVSTCRSRW